MSIIEKTWKIVEQFTTNPHHVIIDKSNISSLAHQIKEGMGPSQDFFIGKPKWFKEIPWGRAGYRELYELVAYELILDSVNYNYWYGRGDIRPNGASSYEMSKLLDKAFNEAHVLVPGDSRIICAFAIKALKKKLINNRYPNLVNRLKHLDEIETTFHSGNGFSMMWIEQHLISDVSRGEEDAEKTLETLIGLYPTYASDMFLKRAFLFIIEMNRRVGWFKNDIYKIPIPADYQIPKMLHHFGVLIYDDMLNKKIKNYELILSGSLEECEIRASSIKACKMIAEEAEITMADIDTYLFANRKNCMEPFHLTITTDY